MLLVRLWCIVPLTLFPRNLLPSDCSLGRKMWLVSLITQLWFPSAGLSILSWLYAVFWQGVLALNPHPNPPNNCVCPITYACSLLTLHHHLLSSLFSLLFKAVVSSWYCLPELCSAWSRNSAVHMKC